MDFSSDIITAFNSVPLGLNFVCIGAVSPFPIKYGGSLFLKRTAHDGIILAFSYYTERGIIYHYTIMNDAVVASHKHVGISI